MNDDTLAELRRKLAAEVGPPPVEAATEVERLKAELAALGSRVNAAESTHHGGQPYGDSLGERNHQHAEAYCVMQYECKNGHRDYLWNSRDGVTPFIVRCATCGEEAKHVNWQADSYAPNYFPMVGQRFFAGPPNEPRLVVNRGAPIQSTATLSIETSAGNFEVVGEVLNMDDVDAQLRNRAERRALKFPKNRDRDPESWLQDRRTRSRFDGQCRT